MPGISKFVSAVGVMFAVLVAGGRPAAANAIYTVDRSAGNPAFGHITGELVTDGTLGPVDSFVDWNLTIESLFGTDVLQGFMSGANSFLVVAGDALIATPDGLFFDFGVAGLLWISSAGVPHAGSFWCLEHATGICNINSGETIASKSIESFLFKTGSVKIATLKSTDVDDVPEPASVVLLAAGALAVLRRRRLRSTVD